MRVNNTPIPTDSCTALVALERAGYKVNSECRNGYCGACRLKATGTPTYLNDPIGYKQDGEILVCCVDSAYFGAFRSVISPLCQHSCRLISDLLRSQHANAPY